MNEDSSSRCQTVSAREGVAGARRADRSHAQELVGHLLDRLLGLGLGASPGGAAEAGQTRRVLALLERVLLHQVELIDGDEELVAALVVDLEAVGLMAVDRQPLGAAIDADAVVDVDHEIPGLERHQVGDRDPGLEAPARAAAAEAGEDLVVGQNAEPHLAPQEPAREMPDLDLDRVLGEELPQVVALARIVAEDDGAVVRRHLRPHELMEHLGRAPEALLPAHLEPDLRAAGFGRGRRRSRGGSGRLRAGVVVPVAGDEGGDIGGQIGGHRQVESAQRLGEGRRTALELEIESRLPDELGLELVPGHEEGIRW